MSDCLAGTSWEKVYTHGFVQDTSESLGFGTVRWECLFFLFFFFFFWYFVPRFNRRASWLAPSYMVSSLVALDHPSGPRTRRDLLAPKQQSSRCDINESRRGQRRVNFSGWGNNYPTITDWNRAHCDEVINRP